MADTGEKRVWADGFTRVVELEQGRGSIFAVEEGISDGSNQVIRLTDVNGDGDALDSGERTVWADGLDEPRGITHDGQGNWTQTIRVFATDGEAFDQFGFSVAISGDRVVVGAEEATVGGNSSQGVAYIFERDEGGTDNWGQVKRLEAPTSIGNISPARWGGMRIRSRLAKR